MDKKNGGFEGRVRHSIPSCIQFTCKPLKWSFRYKVGFEFGRILFSFHHYTEKANDYIVELNDKIYFYFLVMIIYNNRI